MDELRSLDQIELDNPGFGLSRRYDREGVEYAIFIAPRSAAVVTFTVATKIKSKPSSTGCAPLGSVATRGQRGLL